MQHICGLLCSDKELPLIVNILNQPFIFPLAFVWNQQFLCGINWAKIRVKHLPKLNLSSLLAQAHLCSGPSLALNCLNGLIEKLALTKSNPRCITSRTVHADRCGNRARMLDPA